MSNFLNLLLLLLLCGCTRYTLGPPKDLHGLERFRLGSFVNKTFAPQLETQLKSDLLALFAKRQTHRIEEPAQAILDITLVDYKRIASVKQERQGLVPRAFTLEATVECSLRRFDGVAFKPKRIRACVELLRDSQALTAEYQSMPQLSALLAEKIYNALTDTW